MASTAEKLDLELWEEAKADARDAYGGHSARAMQYASKLYKARGGRYKGRKRADNRLTQWTRQDWTTKSGRPSRETGERYLPRAAIESLSPAEYGATTRAKRRGGGVGSVVAQPQSIREKTRKFRKVNPIMAKSATPAQIAARKKFAERARSGELAKMRKKATKRNPTPTKARAVKSNPSSKNSTFYVTANLGYGESRHYKTSVSPGANSQRSAANKVAKLLGYPIFVSSRNERPTPDGFPVVRYEFVDDEQTKAVDIFVYPIKIEGRKYSTIRESNPTATRAPARPRTKLVSNGREKNPKGRVRFTNIAGKNIPEFKVAYAVHLADRPSNQSLSIFTKKADAIEAAQEVADRTGKNVAVSRVQIYFGNM